ncbi:hypothetical protein ACEPAI_9381 [Sanghuangporus weigelae]
MADRSEAHPVDETTLANDVVRLLGGENQRLRRELQEVEQRAKFAEDRAEAAESKTAIKKEPTDTNQDLSAAERIQQLEEENSSLRAEHQELGSKYAKEKEKRKSQKAQLKELKAKDTPTSVESPEFLELQQRREQIQAHLLEAETKVKELSQEVEQLKKDKEMYMRLFENANGRVITLTRNDPFAYIDEIHTQRQAIGFTRLRPFQTDSAAAHSTFEAFCKNALRPQGLARLPFVRRKHDIQWSLTQQKHGVAVVPPYRYAASRSLAGHKWVSNEMHAIEGPFELLYETRNFWYYCGTYSTTVIQSKSNGFFEKLLSRLKDRLMRESVEETDLLPPIVRKTIMDMYSQGVLRITCMVFERIGFNEQLYNALLEFGTAKEGPEYAFDYKDKVPKRKIGREENAGARPMAKRSR